MRLIDEIEEAPPGFEDRYDCRDVLRDYWPRIKAALEAGDEMACELERAHGSRGADWGAHCRVCAAVDRFRAAAGEE